MIKRIKLGEMMKVLNKEKRTSANSHYIAVWIKDPELKSFTPLLMTQSELDKARRRVDKNVEDMPLLDVPRSKVSFWRRFMHVGR